MSSSLAEMKKKIVKLIIKVEKEEEFKFMKSNEILHNVLEMTEIIIFQVKFCETQCGKTRNSLPLKFFSVKSTYSRVV